MTVEYFDGEYRFLSNFYPNSYGFSVEHHYQAAKAKSEEEKDWILSSPTAGVAKRRGKKIQLRDGWDNDKLGVMYNLLRTKFADPVLKAKLISTGDAILIEGNTWGDRFWGNCPIGIGENHLGRLLMKIREEYRISG